MKFILNKDFIAQQLLQLARETTGSIMDLDQSEQNSKQQNQLEEEFQAQLQAPSNPFNLDLKQEDFIPTPIGEDIFVYEYQQTQLFSQANPLFEQSSDTPKAQSENSNTQASQQSANKDKKISKDRKHLKGKRRGKGCRNKLQQSVEGYWTKNLLPFGKNHHFKWFQNKLSRSQYVSLLIKFPLLEEIQKKNGITMEDYEFMYKIPELQDIWDEFFTSKVLYRQLMLSRAEANYRLIYIRFMHRFEQSFRVKQFSGISRIIADSQQSAEYRP